MRRQRSRPARIRAVGKSKAGTTGVRRDDLTYVLSVPRHLGFAPPRYRAHFRFTKSVYVLNTVVVSSNVRFNPCYCYDVDPVVGSTAMPGFSELQGLYRSYRMIESEIQVDFMNMEAFPTTCGVVPINYDPTANHSAALAVTYLSQPDAIQKPCGPLTGNGIVTIKSKASTSEFSGSANMHTEDGYTGFQTTAPNNSWFWNIINYPAVNGVLGCLTHITMDVLIEFSELNTPST